jgi:hypothetical protein
MTEGFVVHVKATFVTLALPIVPLALLTTQVCGGFTGCVLTVTSNFAPLATLVANVKLPSLDSARSSPPLSCSTNPEPDRPLMVPPTVYD